MPSKKHTPEEIIKLLRVVEIETGQGKTTAQACKSLGFTEQTYYRWRKEYGGLQISQAKRLKDLEKENPRPSRETTKPRASQAVCQARPGRTRGV